MARYNYSGNPEATQAPGFTKAVLPDGDYLLFIRDVQVREAGTYRITEFKLMDPVSKKFHDYSVLRSAIEPATDEAGTPSLYIRKLGAINAAANGRPIDFDDESPYETDHAFLTKFVRCTIKARTYRKRDGTEAVDNDPRDWAPPGDTTEAQKAIRAFLGDSVVSDLRDRKVTAKAAYDSAASPPPISATPPTDAFSDDDIPF